MSFNRKKEKDMLINIMEKFRHKNKMGWIEKITNWRDDKKLDILLNEGVFQNEIQQSVQVLFDWVSESFGTLGEDVRKINEELNNDRIAKLVTAIQIYERSHYTREDYRVRDDLNNCERIATEAINALRLQMQSDIDYIKEIPDMSMFKKPSVSKAKDYECLARNAFKGIMKGYELLFRINIDLGEIGRALKCIEEAQNMLESLDITTCRIMDDYNYLDSDYWLNEKFNWSLKILNIKKEVEQGISVSMAKYNMLT